MPRSWLKPADEVQRSAFPSRMANESALGVKMTLVVPPRSTQVAPLFPVRVNWLVLHPDIDATLAKKKMSCALVALVPTLLVTVTSTGPAAWAGVVASRSVSDSTVKLVAAVAPKWTLLTPLQNAKPVIDTFVPPAVEPCLGETPVTVGAAP